MKVLKQYVRYYISGTLRERRERRLRLKIISMHESKDYNESVLRKYVRTVILEHINEVCGEVSADVADALATAQMAHLGQTRRSGEPYLTHPIEVANIVHAYYPENPVLCAAALLHDTLEDALKLGNVEHNEDMESLIAGSFGSPEVGNKALAIVKSLTHSGGTKYSDYVLGVAKDPDVLKIKLADMLHNLRSSPSEKQKEKYSNALASLSPDGSVPFGINSAHWKELIKLTTNDREGLS